MVNHVFLYGTLMPGFGPQWLERLVARWRPLGVGRLPGVLYDVGPYPAGVPRRGSRQGILGKVSELPGMSLDALAPLDAYEGFVAGDQESLFLRREETVHRSDGPSLACWVWVYNKDTALLPVIPNGDFAQWRQDKGMRRLGLLG